MTSFASETVQKGEKGQERLRVDKRVKRYLLSKRPTLGPRFVDGLTNYRTEACVGANLAYKDNVEPGLLAFLKGEYDWAVEQLMEHDPGVLLSIGYPVPFSRLQRDLFASSSNTSLAPKTEG